MYLLLLLLHSTSRRNPPPPRITSSHHLPSRLPPLLILLHLNPDLQLPPLNQALCSAQSSSLSHHHSPPNSATAILLCFSFFSSVTREASPPSSFLLHPPFFSIAPPSLPFSAQTCATGAQSRSTTAIFHAVNLLQAPSPPSKTTSFIATTLLCKSEVLPPCSIFSSSHHHFFSAKLCFSAKLLQIRISVILLHLHKASASSAVTFHSSQNSTIASPQHRRPLPRSVAVTAAASHRQKPASVAGICFRRD